MTPNRNQLCINTAIIYMHRFYMIHSLKKFHHYVRVSFNYEYLCTTYFILRPELSSFCSLLLFIILKLVLFARKLLKYVYSL